MCKTLYNTEVLHTLSTAAHETKAETFHPKYTS